MKRMLSLSKVGEVDSGSRSGTRETARPSAPEDDLRLCREVGQGSEAAFEALVLRHQDRVFAFCRRMLGDAAEAEDAAQEVFITLYRSAASFRGDCALTTWLLRIAKNQTLNRIKYLERRARSRTEPLDRLQAEGDGGSTPLEDVERASARRALEAAIGELTEEHRLVVVLRDLEDLSYEEIAEVTGLRIGTIKSRLHRARSALAARLSGSFL